MAAGRLAKRDQRAGTRSRVEFRRDIPVRLLMRKKSGESNLRIGPAARANPGLRPDQRVAAVGGGGKLCRDAMPIGESGADRIRAEVYIADHALVQDEVSGRRGDVREALDQDIVLDILAEGGKTDFARREANRGHRKPCPGGIDHRDFCERRGLAAKARPNAKRLVKAQRGFKKRDGPPIGARIDMPGADNGKSRLRERERGGETGGASARNKNIGLCFGCCERHLPPLRTHFRAARSFWRARAGEA